MSIERQRSERLVFFCCIVLFCFVFFFPLTFYSINSIVFPLLCVFLRCQLRLSFNLFRLNVRSIGNEQKKMYSYMVCVSECTEGDQQNIKRKKSKKKKIHLLFSRSIIIIIALCPSIRFASAAPLTFALYFFYGHALLYCQWYLNHFIFRYFCSFLPSFLRSCVLWVCRMCILLYLNVNFLIHCTAPRMLFTRSIIENGIEK